MRNQINKKDNNISYARMWRSQLSHLFCQDGHAKIFCKRTLQKTKNFKEIQKTNNSIFNLIFSHCFKILDKKIGVTYVYYP